MRSSAHGCTWARKLSFAIAFASAFAIASAAQAVTLRYALIIGNNRGFDEGGIEPLPSLQHAEREAARLRERLVALCKFDPSADRTVLLQGPTRTQVLDAARAIADRMAEDRAAIGNAETLFALFFTGHGLAGRLLLRDGPFSGEDLGKLFRRVHADLSLAVFDACFSGSLDLDALWAKGIRPTPGQNVFWQLPEEVLTAEGSVWYVSSGPDQPSYEDETLGGVFTHFFIEALEQAEQDGPAISLDRIWDYTRRKTVQYTAARGRRQSPQQKVARLQASGPLYFSFPAERESRLVLEEAVDGRFLLAYSDGNLTEVIQKAQGRRRELAVYSGSARLVLLEGGRVRAQQELELLPGTTVVLRSTPDRPPDPGVGRSTEELWVKGFGEQQLTATLIAPSTSWLIGAVYQMGVSPRGVLAPLYMVGPYLQVDRGGFTASALLGYGGDQQTFGTWSYEAHALSVELRAGLGGMIGDVRATVAASLGGGPIWQEFDDGSPRIGGYFQPGGLVGLLYPPDGPVAAQAYIRAGAVVAPGAGVKAGYIWQGYLGGGVALTLRIW